MADRPRVGGALISKPPEAPPDEQWYPPDGGQAEGTDFAFRWSRAEGSRRRQGHRLPLRARQPAGHAVAAVDELRETDFADRGQGRGAEKYTLPGTGLLDGRQDVLLARTRQRTTKGVWGPWSKTSSSASRGPAYPLAAPDYDQSEAVASWMRPMRRSRRSIASTEATRKVSPQATHRTRSMWANPRGTCLLDSRRTFIAKTTATKVVLGGGVDLPLDKTYYRVVAVDQEGTRSRAVPAPHVPRSNRQGRLGSEYRYQLAANDFAECKAKRLGTAKQIT